MPVRDKQEFTPSIFRKDNTQHQRCFYDMLLGPLRHNNYESESSEKI
jgi:hypothetical protein